MAHSVEKRFIAIIFAVLVLLVAPLFVLFFQLSASRYEKDALDRGAIILEANAKALGKPLWDFDTESVKQIARAIATGRSVIEVHVRDVSGEIDISVPEKPTGEFEGELLTAEVTYQSISGLRTVGTLEMRLAPQSMFTGDHRGDFAFIAIFVIAVLAIFVTAIIGNRQMVIKPLLKLTAAIEATRRLGFRHHVDWVADDEMGALAANFNEMQERLSREENELKRAHARTTEIYNRTPAMLYSVDADDNLIAVSDYWLLATGHTRLAVIGRPFASLLEPECRILYGARRRISLDGHLDQGVTLKFRCADGRVIDVLIMEAAMEQAASETSLALSVMTDVTELKAAERQNHLQAITDHLTGLLNRQGFEMAIEDKIRIADLEKSELACLFVDLDRFKWINDNLGHAAGDEVLKNVVAAIGTQLRTTDTIARLGGDEFAILVSARSAKTAALEIAARISTAVERQMDVAGSIVKLSASIGIALYPEHAPNAAELLQKSDLAMYARKKAGKNGTRFFDPDLANAARNRAFMEKNIEAGLREDWFDAYLQPILNLQTGRVAGFEALMRLVHPIEGIIPPAGIIQIAEETGSIGRVGERIFEKAVSRLASFSKHAALSDAYVSVNISPLQFEPAMLDRMMAVLMKWGVLPSQIVVEITEAVLMHHNPVIQQVLEALCKSGFRIALDDFGTGYSSLSYLNRFPVDIVKIDQSFIRSMTEDDETSRRKSRMLVEGIKTISHQMNCIVVAEGIEKQEQHDALAAMGVDAGQGYFFSRPLPALEIIAKYATLGDASLPAAKSA
ncbi:putative bifunctional diguanylate cyclase/phosphodiesterase [Rhizobium sp. LjRoot254]|uniref:putative bifunctional diguanylate cyclase/phosphodiesterase n=1 Tax=Rhizobium sp. LjRoot254 TaxID=3342297 RepID=UPI003F500A62